MVNMPDSLKIGNFTLTKPNLSFNLLGKKISNNIDLKYGLDLAGGASLLYDIDTSNLSSDQIDSALESLKSNIERRVNLFGVSEAIVQTSSQTNQHRLIVELPGITDIDQALSLIGQTAQLRFMGETELSPEATESATIYDVFSEDTLLTGADLKNSTVQFNPQNSQPEVVLEFNPEGSKLFASATEKYLNKRIAIFLDDYPITFPVVQSVIPDGIAVISGNFDTQSARSLSAQLNAGALPVPISLVSQNQIGATLGQDTVKKALTAGLVGLAIVAFFMISNYGFLGLISIIGLIVYGLLSLTLYRLIPITLTFPGLVGFILSIGMAVDSNILIFERLKEEVATGKPYNLALEQSFGRAWDSIKDANICTIITGLVLLNPLAWSILNTNSLVKGFATTLLLGILLGLFTGVYVTRNLLRIFTKKKHDF